MLSRPFVMSREPWVVQETTGYDGTTTIISARTTEETLTSENPFVIQCTNKFSCNVFVVLKCFKNIC